MRFRSSSHSLKHVDRELKDLINSSENANKCGECGNFYPTWCSVNLGFSFVVGVPLFIEKFSVAETTMPFLTLNHYQWIDGQERISMN